MSPGSRKNKFSCLQGGRRKQAPSCYVNDRVNHSFKRLDKTTTSILAKGLNFATALKNIPFKKVVCGVEIAQDLPVADDEQLKGDVCRLFRLVKPPRSNISRGEWEELQSLRKVQTVVLKLTTGTVLTILKSGSFQRIAKDPTGRVERTVTKVVEATSWAETIQTLFKPSACVTPRFYGLPKIHKDGCPLLQ